MKKLLVIIAVAIAGISGASAQIFKTINSAEMTAGFMNVFNLPSAGGAFQFGSGWGIGDLRTTSNSPTSITWLPNTIVDPDPYWYQGGAPGLGNKMMEANLYAQVTGGLAGTNVVFEGNTTSFSLATNGAGIPYTLTAFVRDFAPDFSSFTTSTQVISNTGAFSINLNTINDTNRHVQWGVQLLGPNIWGANATELGAAGSATIEAVPEPSTYALLALSAAGLGAHIVLRRRR